MSAVEFKPITCQECQKPVDSFPITEPCTKAITAWQYRCCGKIVTAYKDGMSVVPLDLCLSGGM